MTLTGDVPPVIVEEVDGDSSDAEAAPFWRALRTHKVVVQECQGCSSYRLPPMPACPHCGNPDTAWRQVSGTGTVYSWVRVHRTKNPLFAESVPYVIAAVEIAPGCRTFGRLEGVPKPTFGQPVQPRFVDHTGWTELQFQVAPPTAPSLER